jgi:hypothetical protein
LADVIGDALVELERKGELPDWGARVIARALANKYSRGPTALHQFAATGRIRIGELAVELGVIGDNVPEDSIARRLVDVLGTYLLAEYEAATAATSDEPTEAAEACPPPPEPDEADAQEAGVSGDEDAAARVARGIRQYGAAFRAYLMLPDVNAERPDLLRSFTDFYIGSFRSMVELLGELTDARACMAAVQQTAEQFGFEAYVTLDYLALGRMARETWDVVELEGRLYVFTR